MENIPTVTTSSGTYLLLQCESGLKDLNFYEVLWLLPKLVANK
jgi:hypothetical protein